MQINGSDDHEVRGTVLEVGMQFTRVRTEEGGIAFVPNSELGHCWIQKLGEAVETAVDES